MTKLFSHTVATIALMIALGQSTAAADSKGGVFDFGKFLPPTNDGQFVEVNINKTLISMIGKLAASEEPEVGKLINGLELIHVNVAEVSEENREMTTQRITELHKQLDDLGWERIVTVREKRDQVAVYLKTQGDDAIEGIFVSVLDPNKEVVLVNIVGNIRPEQLGQIGQRLKIKPLEKVSEALGV